ncbi:ParB/RepB/Spo0J family partition protein [Candidatus Bandiella numerosa]|uniref:ParB/RepB/Spo0J family partition protein n=1 Tax=Candidatus Bandiella numerosa TaxID=2570586 RepID=UPI001F0223F6|nr:ParB/RepB/Spo0J family partition protein [Candidatus Bandiella numerosa]
MTKKIKYRKISEALERLTVPEIKNSRLGIGYEEKVKEFYMINVENLIPFKNQARIYFDDKEIENLSESIKRHGIRQPLTIVPYEDNKGIFEVISGERRLKAAKIVGLNKVPCIIIHDRNIAQEIAIVENIHRQDLHPIELGLAFNILLDKGAFNSQSSLADTLSMSESTISEYIKYTKIPEEIRYVLIKKRIKSRDKLRKILLEKDDVQKIKQILGLVEVKKETKSFSVMRINILNDKFKFQLNGIEKLKIEQKEILKKQLLIVISKL